MECRIPKHSDLCSKYNKSYIDLSGEILVTLVITADTVLYLFCHEYTEAYVSQRDEVQQFA